MILHIINSYSSSILYKNLIEEIDSLGIPQIVYYPARNINSFEKNKVSFKTINSKIVTGIVLNNHIDKLFYKLKIRKVINDIESKIQLSNVSQIHAHTWYSDGGVAYKLSLKHDVPFVLAIRNTDINLFLKYMFHLRVFGRKILLKASKIILISESYKKRILNEPSLQLIRSNIAEKLITIPNGVDNFWINNTFPRKHFVSSPVKIIYIGKFVSGKNVVNLQNAILLLNKSGVECVLHLVGGDGNDEIEVLKKIKESPEVMKYHGKIFDKLRLAHLIRDCDIFAMPSKNETFGLVYMEALLQGLPVLYTKGEGIDGFYGNSIGEGVTNMTSDEIARCLRIIIENYSSYKFSQNLFLENHSWENIALKYSNIYSSLE